MNYSIICLIIVVAIISDRLWVKITCTAILAFIAAWLVINVILGKAEPATLIMPAVLVLLAMYIHGVHNMFDSKKK